MRSVNKVILIGNATRDAELRHTDAGKAVSSIRLATNRKVGDGEESQYHSIVCWEGLAEVTAKYVKKGDPLYVEGRLQYRSFQDDEGKERGVVEIVASDVQFLGRRKDDAVAAHAGASAQELVDARRALRVRLAGQDHWAAVEDAGRLRDALGTLGPREAMILSLRYGLHDGQPRTLQQVADQVGLTRERVRQLEKQSLAHLRAPERGERLLDWAS